GGRRRGDAASGESQLRCITELPLRPGSEEPLDWRFLQQRASGRTGRQLLSWTRTPAGLGFSVLDYQDPLCAEQTVIIIRSSFLAEPPTGRPACCPATGCCSLTRPTLERASLRETVHCLKACPRGRIVLGVAKPCPLAQAERRAAKAAEAAAARQGRMTRKKVEPVHAELAGQYIRCRLSSAALAMSPTPSSPRSRLTASMRTPSRRRMRTSNCEPPLLREELGSAFDLLAPQSGAPMLPPPQPQPPRDSALTAGGDTTTAFGELGMRFNRSRTAARASTLQPLQRRLAMEELQREAAADEQSDEEAALTGSGTEIVQLTMASPRPRLRRQQQSAAAAAADRSTQPSHWIAPAPVPVAGSSAYAKEDAEDELQRISRAPLSATPSRRCQAAASAVGDGGCRGQPGGFLQHGASLASIVSSSKFKTPMQTATSSTTTKVDFTVNNVGNGVREKRTCECESLAMALADMCRCDI
uniref:Protein kinase domain-containing protein n=1 Tax=Macrostomum lignano TaxID=282301 RepID=A0A1I8FJ44_9PLAT